MFSYEFSHDTTSKSTFRARLPSIFITCQKMPRLRRNLHLGTTLRSADNAIRKNTRNMKLRDDANLLRLPHKIDVDTLKRTRFGAISHSRDKAISVLGRKSRKTQKTRLRELSPLGRELTTTRRRHYDEPTTTPRRAHDETTTSRRRHNTNDANTGPTPRPPTINGNPSLRFREKSLEKMRQTF